MSRGRRANAAGCDRASLRPDATLCRCIGSGCHRVREFSYDADRCTGWRGRYGIRMKKVLSILLVTAASAFAQGTTIFIEDFSNPTAAAGRFTVTGNGSFASGLMRLSPGSFAVLNPG